MTYEDIYNQAQGGSPLFARLSVAATVWALNVSLLSSDAANRVKKATLAQAVVSDPTTAARRMLIFVLVNQKLTGKEGEISDEELQAVADKLLDSYAIERAEVVK